MTDETARTVANGILAVTAIAATYHVLRKPRLRRVALVALETALMTTIPAYLFREVQQAWMASGRQARA